MKDAVTDTTLKQNDSFIKKSYQRALIPCMLSIISSNVNILFDGVIVGQKMGVAGLAALTLCMPVFLFLNVIGSLITSGMSISASSSIGCGNKEKAQVFYELTIGWCTVASVTVTILGLLFSDKICGILCSDINLYTMVKTYYNVTIAGAFTKIMLYIPIWYLRLDGRNHEVIVVMSVMAVGNILLDYMLIYLVDMGILGAALAGVIAALIALGTGFYFLCDKKSSLKPGIKIKASKSDFCSCLKNGSPSALNNLMQTFRLLMINAILLSYGSIYVAIFAAINCISEFSLCVINSIPQTAFAMLGIFYGEHDSGSIKRLLKFEVKYGIALSFVFGTVCIASSGLIETLYGLQGLLLSPIRWLVLSIFPAVISSIWSGYYNISDNVFWANMIIILRVFILPILVLYLLCSVSIDLWPIFPVLSEFITVFLWFILTLIRYKINAHKSRYLMMPDSYENSKILNFSVEGSSDDICISCQRVSAFCDETEMESKKIMRISLSMEELMTMIVQTNESKINFDLRLYSYQSETGIRIRYNGCLYNPFESVKTVNTDEYMGVRMIENMVKETKYQKIFGMNMVMIIV